MSIPFKLTSLEHDAVLLDAETPSTRHLLGSGKVLIPPKQLKLEFTVEGQKFENILNREAGAIKPGVKVTLGKDNGEKEIIDPPETFAFYSEDRKWVLTFHNHEKLDGVIVNDDLSSITHFGIENGEFKVNGNIAEKFPSSDIESTKAHFRKLAEETEANKAVDYWANCHSAQSSGMSGVDLGMAIGSNFYFSFGTDESIQLANSYIVLSNTVYEAQMDISIKIADIFIATTDSAASWTSPNCRTDISTQLNRMRSWNKPSTQPLWHLVDDCFGFSGSTLGIAYIAGLCSRSTNVGVTYYSESFNARDYPTWNTLAHELGHNFNAQHSFEEGQGRTGGLMDYGPIDSKTINGVTQFNTQYRQREVCREVQTSINQGCVDVGEGNEVKEFTVTEKNIPGEIDCTKAVHRAPIGNNNLFVSRSGFSLSQCNARCANDSDCTAFVYGDTGHCELFANISPEDTLFSPYYDVYYCGATARNIIPSEDDLLESADTLSIQEQCCTLEDNKHVQGLNRWLESDITKEQCFESCIKNSGCEAASWEIGDEVCLFFGGADYSNELYDWNGAFTLQCSSSCITAETDTSGFTNSKSKIGTAFGVLSGIGAVATVAGFVYKFAFRKKSQTPQPGQSL